MPTLVRITRPRQSETPGITVDVIQTRLCLRKHIYLRFQMIFPAIAAPTPAHFPCLSVLDQSNKYLPRKQCSVQISEPVTPAPELLPGGNVAANISLLLWLSHKWTCVHLHQSTSFPISVFSCRSGMCGCLDTKRADLPSVQTEFSMSRPLLCPVSHRQRIF